MSGFVGHAYGRGYFNIKKAIKISPTSNQDEFGTREWRAVWKYDSKNDVTFFESDNAIGRALATVVPAEPNTRLHEIWYFPTEPENEQIAHSVYHVIAWLLRPDQAEPEPVTVSGFHDRYGDNAMILIELPDGKLKPISGEDIVAYDSLEDAISEHIKCRREAQSSV